MTAGDSEQNLALVRRATEAFRRGEMDEFMGFLDPEIEIWSSPELANAGTFHGHEGYLRWTSEWLDAWEDFEIEAESFEVVGQRHVLISVRQRGKGKGSGVEVEMRACYMVEVNAGRATRFHMYPDHEQARAAARTAEAGSS